VSFVKLLTGDVAEGVGSLFDPASGTVAAAFGARALVMPGGLIGGMPAMERRNGLIPLPCHSGSQMEREMALSHSVRIDARSMRAMRTSMRIAHRK